jgi:hypothetical protein
MDAAYFTTPLAKKLGVKEGSRLQLLHARVSGTIDDLPAERLGDAQERVRRAPTSSLPSSPVLPRCVSNSSISHY